MKNQDFNNLSGKILIASPFMLFGDVFHRSIIYVLSHTKEGSVGLIVNHLVNKMRFKSLFHIIQDTSIDNIDNNLMIPVYLGGPVELERGFFLHSNDYDKNVLFNFHDDLAVSSNVEILKDIYGGSGPKNSLFIIGYTGWEAGQLELELENNLWIISDYDPSLVFSSSPEQKWHQALHYLGIEDTYFASKAGNC
jgi:putative transcriptional regulator